tara:strand:+ start:17861 stop:18115 length:255 start_codon:yes stop_codon:yes gene_type:complete
MGQTLSCCRDETDDAFNRLSEIGNDQDALKAIIQSKDETLIVKNIARARLRKIYTLTALNEEVEALLKDIEDEVDLERRLKKLR